MGSLPAQHLQLGQTRLPPTRHLLLVRIMYTSHNTDLLFHWVNIKWIWFIHYDYFAAKLTPVPKVPVTTSTDSTGSGGKRKRKIQLVSSHRDDHITLVRRATISLVWYSDRDFSVSLFLLVDLQPPPPELGYTITAQDLDEEKKAAINKIQKVLETPGE